jgi:hypothetical protein
VNAQYIAYHYCQSIGPGHSHCVVFDSNEDNARIVANEEIVSYEIFEKLPEQERRLWHSKEFSVRNGFLVIPGLSPEQELDVMAAVINSYGKVTEVLNSYRSFNQNQGGANFYGSSGSSEDDRIIGGYPQLSYGYIDESQVNYELVAEMDRVLNLSTTYEQRREQRRNLESRPRISGADYLITANDYYQYETYLTDKVVEGDLCSESVGPIVYSKLEFNQDLVHVHLRNDFQLGEAAQCFVYGNCRCEVHPITLERVNVCNKKIPCCEEDRKIIDTSYNKDVATFLLYEQCRTLLDGPGRLCGTVKRCTTRVARYRRNFAVCLQHSSCLEDDERDSDFDTEETDRRRATA